jgi:hypothetical protein
MLYSTTAHLSPVDVTRVLRSVNSTNEDEFHPQKYVIDCTGDDVQ